VSLASHLLDRYQLKLKALTLVPSLGGVFIVSIDGQQAYSKRQTGRFPTNEEIDALIDERLGGTK
jgi:selenoprotein W-related protein